MVLGNGETTLGVNKMFKWMLAAVMSIMLIASASAQDANYKIRPGDQLSVEVLEDSSLTRSILVLPDGNISFPLAGTIKAAGLTVSQLRSALVTGLAPNFASSPSVFVSVQAVAPRAPRAAATRRTIEVFLIGEVANPGAHEVARGTSILQFLAQTGGFTRFAAKKRVQLRRTSSDGSSKVFRINYAAIEDGRDVSTAMAPLQDGDVIVVPERRLFE